MADSHWTLIGAVLLVLVLLFSSSVLVTRVTTMSRKMEQLDAAVHHMTRSAMATVRDIKKSK